MSSMANTLFDNHEGDPKRFYQLIQDRINERKLPKSAGIAYNWGKDFEHGKILSSSAEAQSLLIKTTFGTFSALAYQYGECFHLSVRLSYDKPASGKERYLEQVQIECVTSTIRGAFDEAVQSYIEETGAKIQGITPEEVFSGAGKEIDESQPAEETPEQTPEAVFSEPQES